MSYEQNGNSCAAHTLTVIAYLADRYVASQPKAPRWHAIADYVWDEIRYVQADVDAVAPPSDAAVQAWMTDQTSSPFKLATAAESLKFTAKICVGTTARAAALQQRALAVGLRAIDELAVAATRTIEKKDGIAEVISSGPRTQYASIVTMHNNGGFHNVTVCKSSKGVLQVHDSNDDKFIRFKDLSLDPANPHTWAFSSHADPQTYTGLSILLTPPTTHHHHFIQLESDATAARIHREVEEMAARIQQESETRAKQIKAEIEAISKKAQKDTDRIAREAKAWVEKIAKEATAQWSTSD